MSHLNTAARPVAPRPKFVNIPTELKARPQWVVWRYEWRKDKWTKAPYIAGTTKHASHSAPRTWRRFDEAQACYLDRPDFFDGIGYMFSPDDPYVGGDVDHCLSEAGDLDGLAATHLPATYAEISPSGTGVKFIARANGTYGRKTKRGELYSQKRFFTITGDVLPGRAAVAACQEAVDAFAAELGSATRAVKDGTPGAGSRAELAKQIPAAEWEAARQLLRTQINRLLARVRAAAKEETQLAYLLRGDYASFHAKWSFVGLYRADGSLDESQVRAVAATGIKGRGFLFPEYVALMTNLYGAAALAKWGSKERWREELAALWSKAPEPRHKPQIKAKKPKTPRGRASDHGALVERVYSLLQDHRAGAQAIVRIGDIAEALNVHRRTVATALDELRKAERITTRRLAGGTGLLVEFADSTKRDVIYSEAEAPVLRAATPEIELAADCAEETRDQTCVSSETREADHISAKPVASIADAIGELLDTLPRERPNPKTGELKRWPVTLPRVIEALHEHYSGRWSDTAITFAYRRVRKARKRAEWEQLRTMPRKELETKLNAAARTIRNYQKRAEHAESAGMRAYYEREAKKREGMLARYQYELGQRPEVVETEQQMLEVVEADRAKRAPQERTPKAAVPESVPYVPRLDHRAGNAMIARLQHQKAARA